MQSKLTSGVSCFKLLLCFYSLPYTIAALLYYSTLFQYIHTCMSSSIHKLKRTMTQQSKKLYIKKRRKTLIDVRARAIDTLIVRLAYQKVTLPHYTVYLPFSHSLSFSPHPSLAMMGNRYALCFCFSRRERDRKKEKERCCSADCMFAR